MAQWIVVLDKTLAPKFSDTKYLNIYQSKSNIYWCKEWCSGFDQYYWLFIKSIIKDRQRQAIEKKILLVAEKKKKEMVKWPS